MIYRIWRRCSRSRVAAWESAVAAPWDCSVAGVGAMWPALVRAATAELAVAAGEILLLPFGVFISFRTCSRYYLGR